MISIYYLISINIIGLILILIDKQKAIHNKWRIPENTLLFIALIGGCFSMLLGMYLFHHKTKKIKFKLVHLFCLLWVYLILNICYSFPGRVGFMQGAAVQLGIFLAGAPAF